MKGLPKEGTRSKSKKLLKGTRGKQLVAPFYCPVCKEETGEQQLGADMDCGKNEKKLTQLCYRCGYSKTTKVSGRARQS